MRKAEVAYGLIVAASYAVTLWFYDDLPNSMATHWGAGGEPDGYSPKMFGAFITPASITVMALAYSYIPRKTVVEENYEKFTLYFDRFGLTFLIFMFALHLFILAWSLGYEFNIGIVIPVILGPLFYSIGHMLENLDPRWSEPNRYAWPKFDNEAKERIQKSMAPGYRWSGVFISLSALAPEYSISVIIAMTAVVILWSFVSPLTEFFRRCG